MDAEKISKQGSKEVRVKAAMEQMRTMAANMEMPK